MGEGDQNSRANWSVVGSLGLECRTMIFPKSLNQTTLLGLGEGTLVELRVLSVGLDMGAMVRENMRLF